MDSMQLRPVAEAEQSTISRLLSEDLSALFVEFGQHLGTLEAGKAPEAQAKDWITSRKEQLVQMICVKGDYCSFIARNRNATLIQIVAAVSDLLSAAFGALPVYTLATLLVRFPLDELCECDKREK